MQLVRNAAECTPSVITSDRLTQLIAHPNLDDALSVRTLASGEPDGAPTELAGPG
jgi:hypothetical protein